MFLTTNVTQKYDHYYRYDEIKALLESYQEKYPDLARITVTGTTEQGRDILVLEVTNTKTGAYEDKPAYYLEGNIHAGEITGSMVCMYALDVIFSNLENPKIQWILDHYSFYVCPRVSPDGSEHYLTTPDSVRSVPRIYPNYDEIEGLVPTDLDNDGVIRRMRVKDPSGLWKISDVNPRVMVHRAPDEVEGVFYNVYQEGLIENFDGLNIKDAPGKFGNDFNRNYPIGWRPDHEQQGGGAYPLSNPETMANTQFLLKHPNVCSVLDMHTFGGQNLYTPGLKSPKEANPQDMAIYRTITDMAKEENGYVTLQLFDEYLFPGEAGTFGGFDDFCHFALGVPCMTIECWDPENRAGIEAHYPPRPKTNAQQDQEALAYMKWFEDDLGLVGFKDWETYQHPQLGEVEIGGIDLKYTLQNPPIKYLLQELEKHTRFILRQMKTLPFVCFDKVTTTKIQDQLYKVEAVVSNHAFLPTYIFKESLSFKVPNTLDVTLAGLEVVEGKAKQNIGHLEGFGANYGYSSAFGATTFGHAPTAKKVTWLVRGNEGDEATLTCKGKRIGKLSTTVKLS